MYNVIMVLPPPLYAYTHPTNEENLNDVLNVGWNWRLEGNPMKRNLNNVMNMAIIINVA